MSNIKYYDLNEILQHKVQYYMIFGERSNGKSYSVNKKFIDDFFLDGKEWVIMKRYAEDMKTNVCQSVFAPLAEYVRETYNHDVHFYAGKWYAKPLDDEKIMISKCKVMGYALSVSQSDRWKMAQFPNVANISLEEFMSQSASYLPDEVRLFVNIISTIARKRTNVKVFLLGNAISKSSPYSSALNIKLHRMKKGEIQIREYTDDDGHLTRFAIQRTENVPVVKDDDGEKITYSVFGDSGVGSMITSGDFETALYNRECNNVTFSECLKELTKGKYSLFNKHDFVNVIVKFEDYHYKMYHKNGVFGFRECEEKDINIKNVKYIINNEITYKNIINIVNLNSYNGATGINKLLDKLIHAIRQNAIVFINDDNGEDVMNAFRQANVTIPKK